MTKLKLIFAIAVITIGMRAIADVPAISINSRANSVANSVSNVISVTNLKVDKIAYKIVSMDSVLNGDVNLTTILLVSVDGAIGGDVGYTAAFQLTPGPRLQSLKSAGIVHGKVFLKFYDLNHKVVSTELNYDTATNTLKGLD